MTIESLWYGRESVGYREAEREGVSPAVDTGFKRTSNSFSELLCRSLANSYMQGGQPIGGGGDYLNIAYFAHDVAANPLSGEWDDCGQLEPV